MKILVITYSYPPDLTPRAFRWSAIVDELATRGHQVDVLCAARAGAGQGEESRNGVAVHRVRDWLLDGSARVVAGAGPATGGSAPGVRGHLRAVLRRAARAIWRAVYWPDFACGWVIPAVRQARALCATNRYDWVVSVSHPFTGHVVGWLAQPKRHGARWFVDIGDPFYLMREPSPNNRLLYGGLSRAIERRIVQGADAISVTTESTRRLYADAFPVLPARTQVIPPLLSLPEAPARSPRPAGDPVRLVFVGTLYSRLRSPTFLLACVDELAKDPALKGVELHFYGAANDCADEIAAYRGPARVVAHGMVGRSAVLQAMVDADVLVNIGNDSEAQLASKVIEYMAVGRPILNLISHAADASVPALADYPSLTISRESGGVSARTLAAIRQFILEPPAVDPERIRALVAPYSAVAVAGRYEAMLLEAGR